MADAPQATPLQEVLNRVSELMPRASVPEEDKNHICLKCNVVLMDTKCPRCGNAMVLVTPQTKQSTTFYKRQRARQRLREEASSSLDPVSISIEYFRQRRYSHAHRDDS